MFPLGALAAPILATLDGVVVKKLFGSRRIWKHVYVYRKSIVKMKSYTKTCDITQRKFFLG